MKRQTQTEITFAIHGSGTALYWERMKDTQLNGKKTIQLQSGHAIRTDKSPNKILMASEHMKMCDLISC